MNETKLFRAAMFLGLILTFSTVFLTSIPAVRAQSTDLSSPTRLTSRVLRGTVSGSETYYYSMRARRGSVIRVRAEVSYPRGTSFSLDFRGFAGRDGGARSCCEGDSYLFLDDGRGDRRELEKSFTVTTNERFYVAFGFNTPSMDYVFTFDGIELDGEDDAAEIVADGSGYGTIVVPGTSGNRWVNTGIRVRRGDTVTLSATGRVDVNAGWGVHPPRGTRRFADLPNYPVNSRLRYGLAAQIVPTRGAAQKWSYGDSRSTRVTQNGTLYLTVNDDAPDDNSGEFEVQVTIRHGRR